jgi:hypothetical protein
MGTSSQTCFVNELFLTGKIDHGCTKPAAEGKGFCQKHTTAKREENYLAKRKELAAVSVEELRTAERGYLPEDTGTVTAFRRVCVVAPIGLRSRHTNLP